jgi:hypothetical protein
MTFKQLSPERRVVSISCQVYKGIWGVLAQKLTLIGGK